MISQTEFRYIVYSKISAAQAGQPGLTFGSRLQTDAKRCSSIVTSIILVISRKNETMLIFRILLFWQLLSINESMESLRNKCAQVYSTESKHTSWNLI